MSEKKDFLKHFDHIAAKLPLQGDARAAIHNGLEFPSTRDEYWKYTRVSPIINSAFEQNDAAKIDSIEQFRIPDLDAVRLTFVNGEYRADLSTSDLPEGLIVTPMSDATGMRKDALLTHLGNYVDDKSKAFNTLNTSYFKDGAFITVADNMVIEKPVLVLHLSLGTKQASNVRNLFVVGKHAKADFITQFEGQQNEGAFTNVVSEIVADEGAKGSLHILQNEGDTSMQVNTTQIVQRKDSVFTVFTASQSGSLIRNNLNFSVTGEGCESNMYGIYLTSGKQHVDNHTYVDHLVPNCNSNELYKGVMTDRSTGVFNGKIMVHKDAQKTNAFQSNQNILLTDKTTVNTKPELEIYADDVKCSHGCTIGQLDTEALFYLQSRGLGKDEASKLLIQAFASDVLSVIEIEPLKAKMEAFIQRKFALINA